MQGNFIGERALIRVQVHQFTTLLVQCFKHEIPILQDVHGDSLVPVGMKDDAVNAKLARIGELVDLGTVQAERDRLQRKYGNDHEGHDRVNKLFGTLAMDRMGEMSVKPKKGQAVMSLAGPAPVEEEVQTDAVEDDPTGGADPNAPPAP